MFRNRSISGMSKSFPFTFPAFPFDHSGKGKEGKDLSPFPKLMKPFPVANYSFPGKGKEGKDL